MTRQWKRITAGLILTVSLSACATPMASRAIVMPRADVSALQQATDQADCRSIIESQFSSDGQAGQAAGSALVGALLGAALGAAMGGSIGAAGLGATMGTVGGAAGGLGAAGRSAQGRQNTYNAAMAGCLSEKGYKVLGVGQ